MKPGLFAAVSIVLMPLGAHAADLSMPPPKPTPAVTSWAGPYVGAQVGYLWGHGHSSDQGWDENPTGWKAGLLAGYNFDVGGVVLGVEGGVSGGQVTGSVVTVPGETFKLEENWDASLVGHIGIPVADNLLLYGLVGGTVTQLTGQYVRTIPPPSAPPASDTVAGWTAGVGAEYRISDMLSMRGEYRFASYGTADLTCSICGPTTLDLTTNAVTIGLLAHW